MNSRISYLLILILARSLSCVSQELQYSYYTYLPFFFNPAVCGNHYEPHVLYFNHSRQWSALNNPTFQKSYFTYEFQIYNSLNKRKGCNSSESQDLFSGGVGFLNQKCGVGDLQTNSAFLCFAYTKALGAEHRWSFSLGSSVGLTFMEIDYNKFQFLSQWDSSSLTFQNVLPSSLTDKSDINSYLDVAVGFNINYKGKFESRKHCDFQFGGAILHLNKPNNSFIESGKSDYQFNLHGYYRFVTGMISIEPRMYYSLYGKSNQIIIGSNLDIHFDGFRAANENRDNQTKSLYLLTGLNFRLTPIRDIILSLGLRYRFFAFYLTFTYGLHSYYSFDGDNGMQFESQVFITKSKR